MASPAPSPEDYSVGQTLTLDMIATNESSTPVSTVQVGIRKLIQPRTLSCCMVVDVLDGNISNDPLLLKLYDSRFSSKLRSEQEVGPWTETEKGAYIEAIRSGAARQLLDDLANIPDFEDDTEEDWDQGQVETYLAYKARKLFVAETTVYDRLQDLQGTKIPRLLAQVRLPVTVPDGDLDDTSASESLDINGVLLQYIDGFPLPDIVAHAPRSQWQNIVDQAVTTIRAMGDCGVMNHDVRSDSFLVARKSDSYHVFMIDFGLARLRYNDESDQEWATDKLMEDEDGAVGYVMKQRLAQHDFELLYQPSDKYRRVATIMDGDDEK
ncbi:hypothetical protein LIA77_01555 [Sarocladium implicatum]|nr:hypothetical protein LIA77_01555 [Sarocladium implicatum]